MIRDDATERQVRAAAPDRSTWLSANAGSGKTRVLTDRVARLLLSDVEPQHILCLTYTKAAASEMQNRLFKRLGEWAMKEDDALRAELRGLGAEGPFDLENARTLFARAIETPGGLKIQTIHSFCAALLRRFPLEAGVSPQFAEAEDRATALLRAEIVEAMAEGDEAPLVAEMARHLTDESFDDISRDVTAHAAAFRDPLPDAELARLFGLPSGFDHDQLLRAAFPTGCEDVLPPLVAGLMRGSSTDAKNGEKLSGLEVPSLAALPVLEGVFLSGKGAKEPFAAKSGSFPTKKTQAELADLMPAVEDWMRAIEAARNLRLGLAAAERMRALHGFAQAFVRRYEHAKQQRGWLDFNDLILRARDLLSDPAVAAWVLFRLDGGIDHILVDEAQDTSPEQWEVIERLAREFTSGEGARADRVRTIFVVGDKKQSIYSFQGADPREFDRMRADFATRLEPSASPLQVLELAYSFRSAPAILSLVDTVFTGRERAGFGGEEPHRAFKTAMPGRVDLWPVVEKAESPEDQDWTDPVDQLGQDDHRVTLARRIAAEIGAMIARKEPVPAEIGHSGSFGMRPVRAGDFLILVQRRSDLFHEIILACKEQGLPIAGADRLKVGGELAVRDIAALLSFLATPEDELSLAVALKSPLFGWDEQMLFDLAHKRGDRPLWPALRDRRAAHPETLAVLDDLRLQVDYLRPYELIERILTRHDGRRKLLARLGDEAEDGIDALLSQALAYERSAVPSLTGFLVWMETDDLEIKRQLDSAGDRIRVMTVHGSKGLESPIVVLPDCAQRRESATDRLLPLDGRMVWGTRAEETPAALAAARNALVEARRDERDRLLYVALTRAEKWLIVAAAGDLGKDGAAWHDRVRVGMESLGAGTAEMPTGQGLRLESGDWGGPAEAVAPGDTPATEALPAFYGTPAVMPERFATLSPSDLGGAKALPGEAGLDEAQAKRRGRQVHRLLEHLPGRDPSDWPETAARLLRSGLDAAGEAEVALLLDEARRVLSKPELAPLFSGEALAEVPVSAEVGLKKRLHGVIDRLILSDDHVLAVDFKTNAVVPDGISDVPEGLLRQMGAYALALEQVFPGRRIEVAILWTRTATLMRLPHDIVTAALSSTRSA
ncbi:double-strand break repair helicase AddA [Pseudooceanicola nanhaiensis]|uniref:DNA 3'-5' helicase n=1 Tax=Pseudooceanicola nanhaiensis TaxID=375761 RepID=A0A917T3L8_9RHOB|nr:double-strand break repair helicase AddA [Pseudooceanicola nanhaiensis]GGM08128.1 double-strand break repair helicase AddA [Pseudooceanicola nanhaiensis]